MKTETLIKNENILTDSCFSKEGGVWYFEFSNNLRVQVESFWRLLHDKKVKWTSKDHEQLYGRKEKIDIERATKKVLLKSKLLRINRNLNTGDLYLEFDNNFEIEIIADSSGYECWGIINGEEEICGMGQGDISISD